MTCMSESTNRRPSFMGILRRQGGWVRKPYAAPIRVSIAGALLAEEGEHFIAEAPAGLVVQRLDGAGEVGPLGRAELQHFAPGGLDRLARLVLFLDGEIALGEDGRARSLLDALLQLLRPALEFPAVHVDAAREIAVVGEGVIAVDLVRAVVHRV